jgi:hypothetical protein
MSHRHDATQIPGAHVYGVGSLGILGSDIPSTGYSGAGYVYNDLSFPEDNTKEVCGRITTWPTNGTLLAYEDTSFEYTALSDGTDSFQYQLYVDGVATGSQTTVTLNTGATPVTIICALGTAGATGKTATITANATLAAYLGQAIAQGYTATISSTVPTIGRPSSDISAGAWVPSTPGSLYAMIDEVTPDDLDYIYTNTLGSVCKLDLNATQYPGSASQQISFRAASTTGNSVIVRLVRPDLTVVRTITQTLTTVDTTYQVNLTAGEIALITSGSLSVELESA